MTRPGSRRASRMVGTPLATIALLSAAVFATTGCTTPATPRPPSSVTIGLLADTTGPGDRAGADAVHGAQLAVDLINGAIPDLDLPLAGTIGVPALEGAVVMLALGDTGGDPLTMSDVAGRLVHNDHANVLVVADSAEVAAAAGSEAQRLTVPVVDGATSADYLTELGLDWYFRVGPSDRSLADLALAAMHDQVTGPAQIALLGGAAGPTAAMAETVQDLAGRAGDTVWASETAKGWPQVEPGRCDAIVAVAGTPDEARDALSLATDIDTPLPLLALGSGFAGDFQLPDSETGTRLPAVLRATSWSADFVQRSPAGRGVAKMYRERFDAVMTATAALSFTATMAAVMAIDEAGSADPAGVRNALRQLSVPATQLIVPWNGLRFDSNGQNELAAGVIEARADNGFRLVFPRELATAPMVWARP